MITEANTGEVEVITPTDHEANVAVGGDSFFGPVIRVRETARVSSGETSGVLHENEQFDDNVLSFTANASLSRAEKYGSSASAWVDAGASALAARRLEDARSAFSRALELEPANRRAILGLARSEKDVGLADIAVSRLRELLAKHPDDVEVRVSLALSLLSDNRRNEALELLQLEAESTFEFASLLAARGGILLETGKVREAISDLRKAVRLRPEWVYARNVLGIAEERIGNRVAAKRRFREAVRTNPTYVDALLNLIRVLEMEENWNEIIDIVERYWDPSSTRFDLAFRVGLAALKCEDFRTARRWCQGAVERATDNLTKAWALNNLAVALEGLGRVDESAETFFESVELQPFDISISNIGKLFLERGQAEHAVSWLTQISPIEERGAATKHTLVVALLRTDRLNEARQLAESLTTAPTADAYLFALLSGLYADDIGDFNSSLRVAQRGLTLWPDNSALKNNLAYALIYLGRFDEAQTILDQLLESSRTNSDRVYPLATLGLLRLWIGDLSSGWVLYEEAAQLAGRAALRERIKVKRDLEMSRALLRLGHPRSEVIPYLRRAAAGHKAARPYVDQANAELQDLTSDEEKTTG